MVMSRDSDLELGKNKHFPNFILNFRKVTKFGGNWLKNKKVTGKNQLGGGKVLIQLRCQMRRIWLADLLVEIPSGFELRRNWSSQLR